MAEYRHFPTDTDEQAAAALKIYTAFIGFILIGSVLAGGAATASIARGGNRQTLDFPLGTSGYAERVNGEQFRVVANDGRTANFDYQSGVRTVDVVVGGKKRGSLCRFIAQAGCTPRVDFGK